MLYVCVKGTRAGNMGSFECHAKKEKETRGKRMLLRPIKEEISLKTKILGHWDN